MSEHSEKFTVGITAAWFHDSEERTRYDGRPLLFVEQSMAEWLMSHGELVPMMIPAPGPGRDNVYRPRDFAERIDGLVIQGGVDIAPQTYGDTPIRPEWSGDAVRDEYELALVEACLEMEIPVLAICRGHQLLNVALGGTLMQDISTLTDTEITHRDPEIYHLNSHDVVFDSQGRLAEMYGLEEARINSVHHQAVETVGDGLSVEARCPDDGIIESVRYGGSQYAVGVQWHPEFQEPHQTDLVSTQPLLNDFTEGMRRRWAPRAAM